MEPDATEVEGSDPRGQVVSSAVAAPPPAGAPSRAARDEQRSEEEEEEPLSPPSVLAQGADNATSPAPAQPRAPASATTGINSVSRDPPSQGPSGLPPEAILPSSLPPEERQGQGRGRGQQPPHQGHGLRTTILSPRSILKANVWNVEISRSDDDVLTASLTGENEVHSVAPGPCDSFEMTSDLVQCVLACAGPHRRHDHLRAFREENEVQDTPAVGEENDEIRYTALELFNSAVGESSPPLNLESSPLNVESSPLNVESSSLNVESSPLNVESSHPNVESSPLSVESSPLNLESSPLNVESSPLNVESSPLNVESSPLNVEPSPLNVESSPPSLESPPHNEESSPLSVESSHLNVVAYDAPQHAVTVVAQLIQEACSNITTLRGPGDQQRVTTLAVAGHTRVYTVVSGDPRVFPANTPSPDSAPAPDPDPDPDPDLASVLDSQQVAEGESSEQEPASSAAAAHPSKAPDGPLRDGRKPPRPPAPPGKAPGPHRHHQHHVRWMTPCESEDRRRGLAPAARDTMAVPMAWEGLVKSIVTSAGAEMALEECVVAWAGEVEEEEEEAEEVEGEGEEEEEGVVLGGGLMDVFQLDKMCHTSRTQLNSAAKRLK